MQEDVKTVIRFYKIKNRNDFAETVQVYHELQQVTNCYNRVTTQLLHELQQSYFLSRYREIYHEIYHVFIML